MQHQHHVLAAHQRCVFLAGPHQGEVPALLANPSSITLTIPKRNTSTCTCAHAQEERCKMFSSVDQHLKHAGCKVVACQCVTETRPHLLAWQAVTAVPQVTHTHIPYASKSNCAGTHSPTWWHSYNDEVGCCPPPPGCLRLCCGLPWACCVHLACLSVSHKVRQCYCLETSNMWRQLLFCQLQEVAQGFAHL